MSNDISKLKETLHKTNSNDSKQNESDIENNSRMDIKQFMTNIEKDLN